MFWENLSYIPLTSTPTLWTSISRYKSWILLLLIPLSTACIHIVKKTFPIKGIIRPCSTHIRFCISLKKLFFETYYNRYKERHCLCKSFWPFWSREFRAILEFYKFLNFLLLLLHTPILKKCRLDLKNSELFKVEKFLMLTIIIRNLKFLIFSKIS